MTGRCSAGALWFGPMALYDEYEPNPAIQCPECDEPVVGWQGKDGPCALLCWRQGQVSPTPHPAVEEGLYERSALQRMRLPGVFGIRTRCTACTNWVEATCFSEDGVWTRTVLGATYPATLEPTFGDEHPHIRRRCSRCGTVWLCEPAMRVATCGGCGKATRLVE
jgi:hypothetical protein